MSNLPNTPLDNILDNIPDDSSQDDADNVVSIKPGSIFGGTPGASEKGFVPEIPVSAETQRSPETVPVPQPPLPKNFKHEYTPLEPAPTQPLTSTPNVIDKTEQITTLHEIKSTTDSLTKEADEEEEHFIEEVEKQHGDL